MPIPNNPYRVGDRVRYIGPSMFESGKGWTGEVTREPLTPQTATGRADDSHYFVQVGVKSDGRPKLHAVYGHHIEKV